MAGARDVLLTEAGVDIAAYFGDDSPPIGELVAGQPEISQYLLFVRGVAAAVAVEEEMGVPGVLVGHSLGEIAALCAARALSTAEGVRSVVRRTRRVAEALSVAGMNRGSQIVVAGPLAALERYQAPAAALGLRCVRVDSPSAFHSPLLTAAAVHLAADLGELRLGLAVTPVYSPILGRFYRAGEAVAGPLASPVRPFRLDLALPGRPVRAGGGQASPRADPALTAPAPFRQQRRHTCTHASSRGRSAGCSTSSVTATSVPS